MPTKVCGVCKEHVPIVNYTRSSKTKDGLYYACKLCKNASRKPHVKRNRKQEDPLKARQRMQRFLEANPNYMRDYDRSWRMKNPEKARAKKSRSIVSGVNAHNCQLRRARIKRLPSNLVRTDWESALSFFNHCCAYCKSKSPNLQREHVIPVTRGGGYVRSNIIPSCPSCNRSKSNTSFEDWYRIQSFFNAKNLYAIYKWVTTSERS